MFPSGWTLCNELDIHASNSVLSTLFGMHGAHGWCHALNLGLASLFLFYFILFVKVFKLSRGLDNKGVLRHLTAF